MKISAKQYAQTLYEMTDGKTKADSEKLVADFAEYLKKERKLKLADKIVEQFGRIYNEKNDIIEAEVIAAEKISNGTEKKLKDYIEKKYHAKKVVLNIVTDAQIKGGIIIKVGDEVMDGSISGHLVALKKALAG